MNVRSLRILLWFAGAALLAAAALAVVVAVARPLPDLRAAAPVVAEAGVASKTPDGEVPELATFEPAWSVNLRRPLTDAAASPATAAGFAEGSPAVRLVGTIVDGARSRGVFVIGLATIELRGVGEKAGGADVVRVDERSATLSYAGREVNLKLEKLDPLGMIDPPTTPPPSARSDGGAANGQ